MNAVEKQGDSKKLHAKQSLMDAHKEREASLNNGITKFLVKRYGHDGDPPPKQKQTELVM